MTAIIRCRREAATMLPERRIDMKLVVAAMLLFGVGSVHAETPSFVDGSDADRAAITEMLHRDSAKDEAENAAADLDWENAFGIRYRNLAKRDKFYGQFVKPQMADLSDDKTLEVKVRFLTVDLAVADEYWHIAGQVYGGETKPGADRWGRTTSVFKKVNGTWMLILSRVADLRDPYFKHYEEMPAPAHLPAGVLESIAGRYQRDGAYYGTFTVNGDHLDLQRSETERYVGIPLSATRILLFWPDDTADYRILDSEPADQGRLAFQLTWADGSHARKIIRIGS